MPTPNGINEFEGWYENGNKITGSEVSADTNALTIEIDENSTDRDIKARFIEVKEVEIKVSVESGSIGKGTIEPEINGRYKEGETIEVVPTPNGVNEFEGWYENGNKVTGSEVNEDTNALTIEIDKNSTDRDIKARFKEIKGPDDGSGGSDGDGSGRSGGEVSGGSDGEVSGGSDGDGINPEPEIKVEEDGTINLEDIVDENSDVKVEEVIKEDGSLHYEIKIEDKNKNLITYKVTEEEYNELKNLEFGGQVDLLSGRVPIGLEYNKEETGISTGKIVAGLVGGAGLGTLFFFILGKRRKEEEEEDELENEQDENLEDIE